MLKLRYIFLFLIFNSIQSSEICVEHINGIDQATNIECHFTICFTTYKGVLPNKSPVQADMHNAKEIYSCKSEQNTPDGKKVEISKNPKADFDTLKDLLSTKFTCKK